MYGHQAVVVGADVVAAGHRSRRLSRRLVTAIHIPYTAGNGGGSAIRREAGQRGPARAGFVIEAVRLADVCSVEVAVVRAVGSVDNVDGGGGRAGGVALAVRHRDAERDRFD